MATEYNSIQFNSHKNIAIKEIWVKKRKDQIKTQNVMKFGLKMPTSSGLSTFNNWVWAETLKNNFTLVELGRLYKNGLPSLSATTVTIHSKRWVTTHSRKCEHYSSRKVYKKSRSQRIKLREWRETRLSLNKNLANWVFLSLELSLSLCIWLVNSLE
jgi:hypothetical protein